MTLKTQSIYLWSIALLYLITSCTEESVKPALFEDGTSSLADVELIGPDNSGRTDNDSGSGIGSSGGSSGVPSSTGLPNRFQLFFKETSFQDDIFTFHSERPTSQGDWSNVTRPSGSNAQTSGMITTAQFADRMYVAYKGKSSSNVWYTSSLNGQQFTSNKPLESGARTAGNIDLVTFKNKLWLYHDGQTQSKLFYNELSSPFSSWTGNQPIGGIAASPMGTMNVYDLVAKEDTLWHIGSANNGFMLVSFSTDGKNFQGRGRIPLPNEKPAYDITNVVHNGVDMMLVGMGNEKNRELWLYDGRNFFEPRRVRISGQPVECKYDASIASDGSRLVIAYQEQTGQRIKFAYSDDEGYTWYGGGTTHSSTTPSPTTVDSGLEMIYTTRN